MKIKLTKLSINESNEMPFKGKGAYTPGSIFIGEQVEQHKKPTVGAPFIISTFKTSIVTEILSSNTFKTLNSTYKWETIQ